jgi:DNA invertase Pin-like site-specific DNA recombinase
VSTREQNPGAQDAALRAAGAVRVHGEFSRRANRLAWVSFLDFLRAGDTVLVYRLDRIAGTTRERHPDHQRAGGSGASTSGP